VHAAAIGNCTKRRNKTPDSKPWILFFKTPAKQEVHAVTAPLTPHGIQSQPEPTPGPLGVSCQTPKVTCNADDQAAPMSSTDNEEDPYSSLPLTSDEGEIGCQ